MKRLAPLFVVVGLALLAGTAWAAFEQEGGPYPTGAEPYGVYAADFSGDGRPDVAVLNGTSSNVNLFVRQPTGGFVDGGSIDLGQGTGPSFATVGDFNGDGRADLAVAKFVFGPTWQVLIQQPGGGLAVESQFGSGAGASAIGAGDFNGDGRADLVVASWGSSSVQIFLRNVANNGFDPSASYATGSNPRQIDVADFNGDQLADIAVTNNGGGSVTVLIRQASGGFASEGAAIPVGTAPQDLVVADFNRDGRNDIAVANNTANNVSVLLRNPTNNGFTEEGPFAIGATAVGITAADFDLDGRTDIAVAGGGQVNVLRRNVGAGFTADGPIALEGAYGVATADFDGDARPDLGISSLGTNQMRMLRNPAPAPPPQPPGPTPTPTPPLPEPVAGRNVNVTPVKGTVKVKLPKTNRYVDLSQAQQLPIGTTIDARKGTVEIKAANNGGTAKFYDGIFKISSQTKGKRPLTNLTLTEQLSCPKGKKAGAAAAKKKSRKLWGDGKGSFRTTGRYSAATVRGTKWLVTDRCGTTTTKVAQGSVTVRDFVKKRNVVVRAGKSYTARKKR